MTRAALTIHVHGAEPGVIASGLRTTLNARAALPDTLIELVIRV
jgi:hypothetical protein